jgi:hypothetical protein
MTSQTGRQTGSLRRAVKGAVASSAMAIGLAIGLLMGIGSATASADILDNVGAKYMEGAGDGQISNYVKTALQLRAQGFKPSKSNLDALQAGWDYLPNQMRLVDALKETIAYQHKAQALQQNANNPSGPGGYNIGGGAPPGMGTAPGMSPDLPIPGGPNPGGVSIGMG